jgi:hypothetical protein
VRISKKLTSEQHAESLFHVDEARLKCDAKSLASSLLL